MKILVLRRAAFYWIFSAGCAAVLFVAAACYPALRPYKTIFIASAAVGMVYGLTRNMSGHRLSVGAISARRTKTPAETPVIAEAFAPPLPAAKRNIDPNDIDSLVEQMLAQDRYALLLRPQIAGNLSAEQFAGTLRILGEYMALVPDGIVELEEGGACRAIEVQRLFLDRYPVTNRQYYEFVGAEGYRQPALWDESILPGLLEFVDRTGIPGPKYWRNGCYQAGEEKHPVVGVSWYEAAAYARWVGKRLPSDAEWVKAGAWPVRISADAQAQRKYPWGDLMDRSRANLWGSGPGHTVPVDQYPSGVSPGGVHQLIGNVWQWTTSNFNGASLPPDDLPQTGAKFSVPLRSIRGGAYDTYFDKQASCQFQSGEIPLGRRGNIGFRCAVGVCDLTLVRPAG